MVDQHSHNSSYREKLIEHLFVGELLRLSWLRGDCSLEIARPEVDNSGYDVVAECHGVVRHIQIKASVIGGKTANQKIHTKMSEKPSGCVVWIYFDSDTMALGPYFYFGGAKPGSKMPDISYRKVAKHTKANSQAVKAERPNLRVVPKGDFKRFDTVELLYAQLFGAI